jgi:hypothetical protein
MEADQRGEDRSPQFRRMGGPQMANQTVHRFGGGAGIAVPTTLLPRGTVQSVQARLDCLERDQSLHRQMRDHSPRIGLILNGTSGRHLGMRIADGEWKQTGSRRYLSQPPQTDRGLRSNPRRRVAQGIDEGVIREPAEFRSAVGQRPQNELTNLASIG